MEFLKKLLLAIVMLNVATGVYSQDYEKGVKAFQKSYEYEKKGEYVKAIAEIKNIYNEDSYEQNLRLGWLNYLSGNFSESISFYQKAIKIMPYSEEAKFGITYPYYALGEWDALETYYNKILETSPSNTTALYKLGMIYYGKGDYLKASNYFSKLVNLYPFSYDGVIMLAWTNLKLKKYREAKVLFYKALMIKPDDKSAQEGLSYIKE
jgi:tetratricopeptide (TPR) repeat protein